MESWILIDILFRKVQSDPVVSNTKSFHASEIAAHFTSD